MRCCARTCRSRWGGLLDTCGLPAAGPQLPRPVLTATECLPRLGLLLGVLCLRGADRALHAPVAAVQRGAAVQPTCQLPAGGGLLPGHPAAGGPGGLPGCARPAHRPAGRRYGAGRGRPASAPPRPAAGGRRSHGTCPLPGSRCRRLHAHHHALQPLPSQPVRPASPQRCCRSGADAVPSCGSACSCRRGCQASAHGLASSAGALLSRASWLEQRWADATSELIKRAVMSPAYMKAAWAQDLQNIKVRLPAPEAGHLAQPHAPLRRGWGLLCAPARPAG